VIVQTRKWIFHGRKRDTDKEDLKVVQNKVIIVNDDISEDSGCSGYSKEDFSFQFNTIISGKLEKNLMSVDGPIPKSWLLIDSKATEHVMVNDELVENIRPAKRGYRIYDSTGNRVSNDCASMGGVGRVVFDHGGPENVLSLCKLGKKYRIVFDSWNGNRFILHKSDRKMIIFEQHPCGLYYYDTNKKVESSSSDDGIAVCDAYKRSKLLVTNVAKTIRLFTTTFAEQIKKIHLPTGFTC